jgi:hypothetical protein
MNINEKALRLASGDVVQKRFCRGKPLDAESVRQQKAIKALQHAWIVFDDSDDMHAIADSNEGKFAGDNKQPLAIRGDATSQLNALPELCACRIYRKSSAGHLPTLADYTAAARSTTLCEIRRNADFLLAPEAVRDLAY